MDSTLIFQFLYISILNFRYLLLFNVFKIKKRWKNKKLKACFIEKYKKTFIIVYYSYE